MIQYIDNQAGEHPTIRCFCYADAGRGKSTFAATFPKPMLVLACDPLDKLGPYRRRGYPGPRIQPNPNEGVYVPTEYIISTHQANHVAIQLEYFIDRTSFLPDSLSAWEQVQDRMIDLYKEDSEGKWATIVLDSMSSLEYIVRSHYQFKENPVNKEGNEQDQRQWYRKSAEGIEQVTYALAWMNANIVVLGHVRGERDAVRDTMLWTPEAPGVRNRRIPSVFGEIYTIHVDMSVDPDSSASPFFLQTRNDGRYMAATQIDAPDDCDPKYSALWRNYIPMEQRELKYGGTAAA